MQQAINSLKSEFAKGELSLHADDTTAICSVHQELFSNDTDRQNLKKRLLASNSNVKAAIQELKSVLTAKDHDRDRIDGLTREHKMQETRKNFLEKMVDVVSTPWTVNQCLLSHQYPQAVQLILTFERAFPERQQDPLVVSLVRKEVKFLRLKLTKTLFMLLETSYLQQQMRAAEFYTTEVLLRLIKIMGEKEARTNEILLKSRAKHLREMTQRKVIESQKIDPLLKPYLDSTMLIFKEFVDLGLPRDECEDWLYDRYAEVRKLVRAVLKPANQAGKGQRAAKTPAEELSVCFDTLETLDQLVQNSARNFQSTAEPGQLIELCISDIMGSFLVTKVELAVEHLNSLLVASKSKSAPLAIFPRDVLDDYLSHLQQRISQIKSLDNAVEIGDLTASIADQFATRHLLPFTLSEHHTLQMLPQSDQDPLPSFAASATDFLR